MKKHKKTLKRMKRNRLIASGGQGCIFRPALTCDTKKHKRRRRKGAQTKRDIKRSNYISKVAYNKRSSDREYKMNQYIRKIPGYEDWAILWDDYCYTRPYEIISKTSDIKICLDRKNIKAHPRSKYPLLIGTYGGEALDDLATGMYASPLFDSQKRFDDALLKLHKTLLNLEHGITEMKINNMLHGDLSSGNVVIKRGVSKIIDFGLSCTLSQMNYLSKRLKFITKIHRMYEPYPYEYMCNAMTKKQLTQESKMYAERDHFDDYICIYENVLGIPDQTKKLRDYLSDRISGKRKQRSVDYFFKHVDTYSLGILIPTILLDVSVVSEVTQDKLSDLCRNCRHQHIFDLCKERISVFDV